MQSFSVYMHRRTSLGTSKTTRIRPNMSTTFKQFNNKAVPGNTFHISRFCCYFVMIHAEIL